MGVLSAMMAGTCGKKGASSRVEYVGKIVRRRRMRGQVDVKDRREDEVASRRVTVSLSD